MTMKYLKEVCSIPDCHRQARFFMGWVNLDGETKHYGFVCASHDNRRGRYNLMNLAGMSHSDAVAFERYAKETEFDEHPIEWEEWLRLQHIARRAGKRTKDVTETS